MQNPVSHMKVGCATLTTTAAISSPFLLASLHERVTSCNPGTDKPCAASKSSNSGLPREINSFHFSELVVFALTTKVITLASPLMFANLSPIVSEICNYILFLSKF